MFVVHIIEDGKPNRTRNYSHVNQFFRLGDPLFRQAKNELVFTQCVEQGFIYISQYMVDTSKGRCEIITYNKTLNELLDEVAYNKNMFNGRRIK